jgi:hypothetical protein
MRKKAFFLSFIAVLLITVSGFVGYIVAYIHGVQKMNNMMVKNYCDILTLESLAIVRKLDTPRVVGLVDAVELHCNNLASFVQVNHPYSCPNTKKRIEEALETWEKAQEQLRKIRALHTDDTRLPYDKQAKKE